MKTNDERNVIISAMEGKEEAFNELYKRYYKLAYFIAYKVCNNEADAQDATQETFIAIKDNITKLQNPDAFKGWLSKITVTKCKRLFRKNYRVNRYMEKLDNEDYLFEQRKEFVPLKQQRYQSDHEVLNSLLDELSYEQRLVIVLFYFQQLSLNEIVEMTGIPLGTVKSRLSYARKALHHKIELYEKENQEKLTFHGVDTLFLTFFAQSFAQFTIPKVLLPVKLVKHRFLHNPAQAMVIAGTSMIATIGVCAAVIVTNNTLSTNNKITQSVYQNHILFQEVILNEERINNAKDAYFSLILWAHDDEELIQKSKDEISDYLAIYEELKRFGGEYYQLLQECNWSDTFEIIKD